MSNIKAGVSNFKTEWNLSSTRRKLLWTMLQILLMAIFTLGIIFAIKFAYSSLDYQYSTYALLLAIFGMALCKIKVKN